MTITAHDFVARHGILNALAMHSRGVDRADLNLLNAAYHPDATADYGFFVGPAATLCEILAGAQKGSLPTLHRTCQSWIKVDGDHAVAESYVIAYAEEAELQRFVFGRYLDRLESRNGDWRLVHRQYVLDGNTNRPNTAQRTDPPVASEHFTPAGAKGASDAGRVLMAFHQAEFRNSPSFSQHGAEPMTVDATALDVALSRAAIQDLCAMYSRGVDRGDKELLASIFHADSTVISGVVNGTGAEFADGIIDYVMANLDYCFHTVANQWIDIRGDQAVGEHYALAHVTAGGQDVLTGGRYIDSYERRDGVWKIRSRTFVMDWSTTHGSTMERDGFYEVLKTRGAFGKGDPVYAMWASN
jgi:hypothetical protein